GNNGGDAFVVAYELAQRGVDIHLVDFGSESAGSADRAKAKALCEQAGLRFTPPAQMVLQGAGLVVDGILGIGCTRAPQAEMAECIEAVNAARIMGHLPTGRSSLTVVALDCPSGLNATNGICPGEAIRADLTLTYIALKTGLLFNMGRDHAGEVLVEPLGCEELLTQYGEVVTRTDKEHLHRLPQRGHQNHKGSFGSLAVIGGAQGMTGACVLASRAAIMMGTGRVAMTLLAEEGRCQFMDPGYPELMNKTLQANLNFADCCVAGPGFAQGEASKMALQCILGQGDLPKVLDADALNLLAAEPDLLKALQEEHAHEDAHDLILTPHPMEAARLLGVTVQEINENRIRSAVKLATAFNAVVVLKGSGTVIANAEGCLVNCSGGPALATGGSGDVLAGVIGAFLAQGMDGFHAAATAVW
ncbi:MAG: NAD(P)H-hydrate dehydratase, partial [Limnobacter sp.]|nr:NAD(P)H-hydrate dehydratase [Limnobacter sp.]